VIGGVLAEDLALRLAATKVLVIGDLMLDCYTWGDVLRI
jgi:bifunctional ADP-heptose synthase (sugar kinase/adenylyltransferase)